MEFFRLLISTLAAGTATLSVPLFLISALLLMAGVFIKARSNIRLSFLEHTPLNHIEFTHPHLPSLQAVTTISLCTATLLLVSLQTVQGTFPFDDPYQGLNLASLFLIGGSICILAELRWRGAREYASAVLVGTALAFLLVSVHFGISPSLTQEKMLVLALLLPTLLLVGYAFAREHRKGTLLAIVCSFTFWILVYFLR